MHLIFCVFNSLSLLKDRINKHQAQNFSTTAPLIFFDVLIEKTLE